MPEPSKPAVTWELLPAGRPAPRPGTGTLTVTESRDPYLAIKGCEEWLRARMPDKTYPSVQILRDPQHERRVAIRPCGPDEPGALALIDYRKVSKARVLAMARRLGCVFPVNAEIHQTANLLVVDLPTS